ncbi:MAG: hypothetical protein K2W95_32715 [Candidatus Obscuribacterales bacterium]|nr:hypothetical protein [Candidatus Obscuribacterales bacterium]
MPRKNNNYRSKIETYLSAIDHDRFLSVCRQRKSPNLQSLAKPFAGISTISIKEKTTKWNRNYHKASRA